MNEKREPNTRHLSQEHLAFIAEYFEEIMKDTPVVAKDYEIMQEILDVLRP